MTDIQEPTTSLSDLVSKTRDEKGRFTQAASELSASEPVVEAPTPQPEPSAEVQPSPAGDKQPGPSPVPERVETDEVKALKAELARVRQTRREAPQPRHEPTPPPSVFDDEAGFTNHLTSQFEDRLFEARISMSEESARERFTDLKDVMGTVGEGDDVLHVNWVEAVKANPELFDKFKRAPNPVVFAYQELKRQSAVKDIGDPATYREKLRAELLAEIAGKSNGQAAQQVQQRPEPIIPDTLAGTSSKSSREAPAWNGPRALSDIARASPLRKTRN